MAITNNVQEAVQTNNNNEKENDMIFVEVSCSSEWIDEYIDANPHSTKEDLAIDRAQYESESFVVRIDDLKGMSVDDYIDTLYEEGTLNEYNYDWATSGRLYTVVEGV